MNNTINKINELLRQNNIPEALKLADELVKAHPDNDLALYTRGKIYWRSGRQAEAITDYTAASKIDPAGRGAIALEQARQVLDYFNPDLINP